MKSDVTREHLIRTTMTLLNEVYELEEITVRKIAEEANVATGLINYYFGSKEELVFEAINGIIHNDSRAATNSLYNETLSPVQRLRLFLIGISDIMVEYRKYTVLTVKHEILNKGFETPSFIEPVLHAIYPEWDSQRIKLLAIQIVAPLQIIFFKHDAYRGYTGIEDDYTEIIDKILLNLGLL